MEDGTRFKKMKNEYEQIPVPEAAKERVVMGITKAKRDRRKFVMIKIGRNTGFTAAAAVMAITFIANLNPTAALAMEDIPVIGAITRVVTFRTYEDTTNNFEAKIEIPHVSIDHQDNHTVNQLIEEYAQGLIDQYERELEASQGVGHYGMESTYDVVTDNAKYLCIRINTTLTMASGTQFVKIFTIDKATGEVITLKELFRDQPDYITTISNEIKKQMKEQMAADESIQYFYGSDDDFVDQFDQIDEDESFYFNNNGEIVIMFEEYEVAPGYMGAVSFTIPKAITGNLS